MDKCPEKLEGEKRVWQCIKDYLPDDVICYHNREIFGREFDFCLVIEKIGLFILEVKGWNKSHISSVVSPDEIHLSNGDIVKSPKHQARGYRFSLLTKLRESYNITPLVMDMVCYPFLSESDYKATGLYAVSEPETTLFSEDISNSASFGRKLIGLFNQMHNVPFDKLEDYTYDAVRHHFEPTYTVKPPMPTAVPYSALSVFAESLSVMSISNIIDSYFDGTKQIIFTNHKDDLEVLAKRITETFISKHIKVNGGSLEFGAVDTSESLVSVKNGKISIFNFEATYIENYKLTDSFIVYNGNTEQSQQAILKTISENSTFNIKQYEIEHAEINKNIEVRAGAGTGKTFSMVSRIAYLCHPSTNSGIYDVADEIAMLTFTADAATNMKSRLKCFFVNSFVLTGNVRFLEMVNGIEKMRISTIHSFAKEIIQNTSSAVGIGSNFATVTGTYEKQKIFDRLFTEYLEEANKEEPLFYDGLPMKIDDFRKNLLKFAVLLYNKGCDIKTVTMQVFGKAPEKMPYFNKIIDDVIIKTEKEFTEQAFRNNCIPLNEYMIYLNKCIESDEFNTNLFKIKYMFIDEFQDTDDAQIDAFHNMQKKLGFKFFIVGDLKQSIYRFRGATMDAFNRMNCTDDEWFHFSLTQNYRSDSRLLARYEDVFKSIGNVGLLPYTPGKDELVGVKTFDDYDNDDVLTNITYTSDDYKDSKTFYDNFFEMIECEKNRIRENMSHRSLSPNERTIAILMRDHHQIDVVLSEAKKRNVVVESDSSSDLYQLTSSKDLCMLTTSLSNPYNTTYLYALINSNYVNAEYKLTEIIGKSEKEKLESMIKLLDDYFTAVLHKSWKELVNDIHNQPVLKVLHMIYENTAPWKKYSPNASRQEYYRMNYELVFEELSNYNRRSYLTLDSVNEMLHINIVTGTEAKSREFTTEIDDVKVICTTVHKSKGLEYSLVILPFTDKVLGRKMKNSLEITYIEGKVGYCFNNEKKEEIHNEYYSSETEFQENKMEEARIMYVAMTRAINRFIWFTRTDIKDQTWGSLLKELENNGN